MGKRFYPKHNFFVETDTQEEADEKYQAFLVERKKQRSEQSRIAGEKTEKERQLKKQKEIEEAKKPDQTSENNAE